MPADREVEAPGREVVWFSHRDDARCDECGKDIWRGNLLQANRRDGLRCGACAEYADLCFLLPVMRD